MVTSNWTTTKAKLLASRMAGRSRSEGVGVAAEKPVSLVIAFYQFGFSDATKLTILMTAPLVKSRRVN